MEQKQEFQKEQEKKEKEHLAQEHLKQEAQDRKEKEEKEKKGKEEKEKIKTRKHHSEISPAQASEGRNIDNLFDGLLRQIVSSLPLSKTRTEIEAKLREFQEKLVILIHNPPTEEEALHEKEHGKKHEGVFGPEKHEKDVTSSHLA